jgi:hypothetical protein
MALLPGPSRCPHSGIPHTTRKDHEYVRARHRQGRDPRDGRRQGGGEPSQRAGETADGADGIHRVDQTSGYVGTVPFFEAHGFSRVCQTAGRRGGKPRWLVRRELP